MNADQKTETPYWVWGVESVDGIITVRAADSSYDRLLNMIGVGGIIPIPADCDGICDVLRATPALRQEIENHGLWIRCSSREQDGALWFDVEA